MKIKASSWIAILLCLAGPLVLCFAINLLWLGIAFDVIVILTLLCTTLREKKEKFCSSCKEQYDFENEVAYTELSRNVKRFKYNPNSDRKQVAERLTYKIRFDCTCGKCGNKKSYVKKFNGGCSYFDGDVELENAEDVIEQWYRFPGLTVNEGKTKAFGFVVGILSLIVATSIYLLPALGIELPSFGSIMSSISGVESFEGEKYLEKSDYYGKYYAVSEQYNEFELTVNEEGVILVQKVPFADNSETFYSGSEYDFYTAEYVEYLENTPAFDSYGALVLDNGDNSKKYFFITDNTTNAVKLSAVMTDGERLDFTTEKKTNATVTGDKKDYYGKYLFDNSTYITIADGEAVFVINGEKETYEYFYADQAMLDAFDIDAYGPALIVMTNKTDFYIFTIENGNLYLSDQLFAKQ